MKKSMLWAISILLTGALTLILSAGCSGGQSQSNTQQSATGAGQPSLDDIELHVPTAVLEYANQEIDPLSLVEYEPVEGFSLSSEDHVDLKRLGVQEVHYLGSLGNQQKPAHVSFTVRDTNGPVIALAEDVVTVKAGEAYDPRQNVQSVGDSVDGEISYIESPPGQLESDALGRIYEQGWYIISGDFNADVAGTYFVTVEACDNHGNKTTRGFVVEVAGSAADASEPSPGSATEGTPEPSPEAASGLASEITYVVNKNTNKFHLPSCQSVEDMKEKNKQEITATRESMLEQGYTPCGRCNP